MYYIGTYSCESITSDHDLPIVNIEFKMQESFVRSIFFLSAPYIAGNTVHIESKGLKLKLIVFF